MKYNCGSCGATGLYRGLCEPEGCAVICLNCSGTGAVENKPDYKPEPFIARKTRNDVRTVYRGGGRMIFFGAGPKGTGISYQDFLDGKAPS